MSMGTMSVSITVLLHPSNRPRNRHMLEVLREMMTMKIMEYGTSEVPLSIKTVNKLAKTVRTTLSQL